jgi:hypothetical protein
VWSELAFKISEGAIRTSGKVRQRLAHPFLHMHCALVEFPWTVLRMLWWGGDHCTCQWMENKVMSGYKIYNRKENFWTVMLQ